MYSRALAIAVIFFAIPLVEAQCTIYYPEKGPAGDFLDSFGVELPDEVGRGEEVSGRAVFTFGEGAEGKVYAWLSPGYGRSRNIYEGYALPGEKVELPLNFPAPEKEGNYSLEFILATENTQKLEEVCREGGKAVLHFASFRVSKAEAEPYLKLIEPEKEYFELGEVLLVNGSYYPERAELIIEFNGTEAGSSFPLRLKANKSGDYTLMATAFLGGNNYTVVKRIGVLPERGLMEPEMFISLPGVKSARSDRRLVAVSRDELELYSPRWRKVKELGKAEAFAVSNGRVYFSRANILYKYYEGSVKSLGVEASIEDISAENDSFVVVGDSTLHYYGRGRWSKQLDGLIGARLYRDSILCLTESKINLYDLEGNPILNLSFSEQPLDAGTSEMGVYVLFPRKLSLFSGGKEVWNFSSGLNFTSLYVHGRDTALASGHLIYIFSGNELKKKVVSQDEVLGLVTEEVYFTGRGLGIIGEPLEERWGIGWEGLEGLEKETLLAVGSIFLISMFYLLLRRRGVKVGAKIKPEKPEAVPAEEEPEEGEPEEKAAGAGEADEEVRRRTGALFELLSSRYSRVLAVDQCLPGYIKGMGGNMLSGAKQLSALGEDSGDIVEVSERLVRDIVEVAEDWRNISLFEKGGEVEQEECLPLEFDASQLLLRAEERGVKEKLEVVDTKINNKLGELTIYPLSHLWQIARELFESKNRVSLVFSLYTLECIEEMLQNESIAERLKRSIL